MRSSVLPELYRGIRPDSTTLNALPLAKSITPAPPIVTKHIEHAQLLHHHIGSLTMPIGRPIVGVLQPKR